MGIPKPPQKVMLFCALLYGDEEIFWKTLKVLETNFGEIAFYSPALKWDFSTYYQKELGDNLKRRYLFFVNLIEPDSLSKIKITTNSIEQDFCINGNRSVNIDPGYITPAKVVLASTKDYSHRIYLSDGIYGEITLIYQKGAFHPHINTYRDYCSKEHQFYFHIGRSLINQK
ncbi:MAG: DUF4416 family protein [Thermodesulfovibrionales bacterium]|nr:DUF4416 family protein [Thermodesulfovibrionales bacterium]